MQNIVFVFAELLWMWVSFSIIEINWIFVAWDNTNGFIFIHILESKLPFLAMEVEQESASHVSSLSGHDKTMLDLKPISV